MGFCASLCKHSTAGQTWTASLLMMLCQVVVVYWCAALTILFYWHAYLWIILDTVLAKCTIWKRAEYISVKRNSNLQPVSKWYWSILSNSFQNHSAFGRYFSLSSNIIFVRILESISKLYDTIFILNSIPNWHSALYWYQTTLLNDVTYYSANARHFKNNTFNILVLEITSKQTHDIIQVTGAGMVDN